MAAVPVALADELGRLDGAALSKVSTTLDLYVGEFENRRVNDSGTRLAAIYAAAQEGFV